MATDDAEFADRLNRFLDALVTGADRSPNGLVPPEHELVAAVRLLQSHDDALPADPRFAERLLEDLMHTTTPHDAVTFPLPPALPRIRAPHAQSRSVPWRDTPRPAGILGQFATAAIVLLALLGSILAFGPGRPGQQPERPVFLPAITGTPATPETNEPPIAELLWQAQGGPDRPFGELGQPAIDPQGNLWVPDASSGQVLIFAPDGTFLEAWGTPGSGAGEFDFTSAESGGFGYGDVAFDATGAFYVADTGNFRIQKFGPNREFITTWGSEGSGPGEFRRPFAVVVDDRDQVYVSDPAWGKIEVFTTDGDWLATWSGLGSPLGLALDGSQGVDLNGNGANAIWVADASAGVKKLSAEGERLATWDAYGAGEGAFLFAMSVAVDAEGRVYVVDMDANRVQVFAPDGTFLGAWSGKGTEPGQFLVPRGIAVDEQGGVYVTEDSGRRIQKFRLTPSLGAEASLATKGGDGTSTPTP